MTSSSTTDVLQLVIGYALDPRSNQRLQRIEIRNSIQLRHLWILRRIHIPSERHTGPHAAVAWFGETSAYLSIMISLLVLMTGYGCGVIGGSSLFQRYIRKFIEDYGTPLTIIFFTGFVNIGKMRSVDLATLPTSKAFFQRKTEDGSSTFGT